MSRTNPLHSRTIQYDVRRKNFSIRLRGVHAGERGSELSKLIEGSLQTSLIASNPRRVDRVDIRWLRDGQESVTGVSGLLITREQQPTNSADGCSDREVVEIRSD
jgi:hypothetical protein